MSSTTTYTFALHEQFKLLPYVFARAFIASVSQAARTTVPYFDTVGVDSMMAPIPNTDDSATLIGIASDSRVTDDAAFTALMEYVNRDAAFQMRAVDSARIPTRLVIVPGQPAANPPVPAVIAVRASSQTAAAYKGRAPR